MSKEIRLVLDSDTVTYSTLVNDEAHLIYSKEIYFTLTFIKHIKFGSDMFNLKTHVHLKKTMLKN